MIYFSFKRSMTFFLFCNQREIFLDSCSLGLIWLIRSHGLIHVSYIVLGTKKSWFKTSRRRSWICSMPTAALYQVPTRRWRYNRACRILRHSPINRLTRCAYYTKMSKIYRLFPPPYSWRKLKVFIPSVSVPYQCRGLQNFINTKFFHGAQVTYQSTRTKTFGTRRT